MCEPTLGIYWCQFDWQSFATLTSGGLAVGAAVIVGMRQLAITNRQNDILEKQADIAAGQLALEQLALRHDLFDRRHEVFERTRDFLLHILQHAEEPTVEINRAFVTATGMSRFLFRPEVHEKLDEIWRTAVAYGALKDEMERTYLLSGHYGDGNPERERDILLMISEYHRGLADIFGDEMKLTAA
ncbi:hypothetical protein [Novosphingobium mathurense]|uniref:Uncharacterized protein n=1 Tax=Novosphingobium mathurense TaxID=428990 RepID=A0A1U6IVL8_9SPHN|nr:hypothetical protein [Novosphingobium mathurense]SLK12048.1 hypothetical protein SAMN06295987_11721 [Novosphingobium mathurense]